MLLPRPPKPPPPEAAEAATTASTRCVAGTRRMAMPAVSWPNGFRRGSP